MLTLVVILAVFMIIAFAVAIINGLIAISPLLLILVCLPVVDYFVLKGLFKNLFGKKKKKEKKTKE